MEHVARRTVLALGLGALVSLPRRRRRAWAAETPGGIIAVLTSHSAPPYQQALEGLQRTLRPLGPGLAVEVFALDGDAARAARPLDEARKKRFRLLVSLGSVATQAAGQLQGEIPVVGGLVLSAEDLKRVPNATGIVLPIAVDVQLEWIRRILPDARRVAVIYSPAENHARVALAVQLADKFGLRIEAIEVHTPRDLPPALETAAKRAEVLWGIVDTLVLNPVTANEILLFSYRNRIPFIGLSAAWVKSGALYALEPDYADIGAQCADMVTRILQGARPASLPVAAPRKVTYSINQRTAAHMKLELSADTLRGARETF